MAIPAVRILRRHRRQSLRAENHEKQSLYGVATPRSVDFVKIIEARPNGRASVRAANLGLYLAASAPQHGNCSYVQQQANAQQGPQGGGKASPCVCGGTSRGCGAAAPGHGSLVHYPVAHIVGHNHPPLAWGIRHKGEASLGVGSAVLEFQGCISRAVNFHFRIGRRFTCGIGKLHDYGFILWNFHSPQSVC